jgi:hypothetical protein
MAVYKRPLKEEEGLFAFGFCFGFGLGFLLWDLALGFWVWEVFGREKNY